MPRFFDKEVLSDDQIAESCECENGGVSNEYLYNDYRNRMPFHYIEDGKSDGYYYWTYGATMELSIRLSDALAVGDESSCGCDIVIDSELSETSKNPVQNKVVTAALNGKLDKKSNKTIYDQAYVKDSEGNDKLINISTEPSSSGIPSYDLHGHLYAEKAEASEQVVNKDQLDEALSTLPTNNDLHLLEAKLNENIAKNPNYTYIVTSAKEFDLSSPPLALHFEVDWGDGTTGNQSNPTHTYTDGYTYHILTFKKIRDIEAGWGYSDYAETFAQIYMGEDAYFGLTSSSGANFINLRKLVFQEGIKGVSMPASSPLREDIIIPSSCVIISDYLGAPAVRLIISQKDPTKISFETYDEGTSLIFVVPKESLKAYKTAKGWSKFADNIVSDIDSSDLPDFGEGLIDDNGIIKVDKTKVITSDPSYWVSGATEYIPRMELGDDKGLTLKTSSINFNDILQNGTVINPEAIEFMSSLGDAGYFKWREGYGTSLKLLPDPNYEYGKGEQIVKIPVKSGTLALVSDITEKIAKLNVNNGTGKSSIQQPADSKYSGVIQAATKNPYAKVLYPELSDKEPIGAIGDYSASFGGNSSVQAKRGIGGGTSSVTKGPYSQSLGDNTVTTPNASDSTAIGYQTTTDAPGAFTHGSYTVVMSQKYVEGMFDPNAEPGQPGQPTEPGTTPADTLEMDSRRGEAASAGGFNSYASGFAAEVDGVSNVADGHISRSSGRSNRSWSYLSKTDGKNSVVEPSKTDSTETGEGSWANGDNVQIIGAKYAYAGGSNGKVSDSANNSFSHGLGLYVANESQAAFGQYNNLDIESLFTVGNGTADKRHNALDVKRTGQVLVYAAPIYPESVIRLTEYNNLSNAVNNNAEDIRNLRVTLNDTNRDLMRVDSNSYKVTGGTISGNVTITGDLTVNGTQHINNTENLNVENAMIYSNAKGATLATNAGIGIKTSSTNVYGIVYNPTNDSVELGIGKSDANGKFTFNDGEGNPVAIRDTDSKLTNNHLIVWDSTNRKFIDSTKQVSDFVDLVNPQTIAGLKTFSDEVQFANNTEHSGNVNITDAHLKILDTANDLVTQYYSDKITIETGTGETAKIYSLTLPKVTGTLALTSDLPDMTKVVTTDKVTTYRFTGGAGLDLTPVVDLPGRAPYPINIHDITGEESLIHLDNDSGTSTDFKTNKFIFTRFGNNVTLQFTKGDMSTSEKKVIEIPLASGTLALDTDLEEKVDKLSSSLVNQAYVRNGNGEDTGLAYTYTAEGNTLGLRNASGQLQVENPLTDKDAVNKLSMESAIKATRIAHISNSLLGG